jgi:hypothetical protein
MVLAYENLFDNNNNKNKNNLFSIYDIGSIDFKDSQLPFEPTAVLAKAPSNQQQRKFSIYDLSNIGFST